MNLGKRGNLAYLFPLLKKKGHESLKPKVTAAYEESLKSVRYKLGVKAFGLE